MSLLWGADTEAALHVLWGDAGAVVIQSRKGGAAAVPFQQTVVLQSQLLT